MAKLAAGCAQIAQLEEGAREASSHGWSQVVSDGERERQPREQWQGSPVVARGERSDGLVVKRA